MIVAETTFPASSTPTSQDGSLTAREGTVLLLLNLFCGMLATGIPLADGLKFLIFGLVVTAGGAALYTWVLGLSRLNFPEAVGVGFATGTAIHALITFIIGESGYRGNATTWICLLAFSLVAAWKFLLGPMRLQVGGTQPLVIIIVPLIVVVGYHAWAPLLWPFLLGNCLVLAIHQLLRASEHRTTFDLRFMPTTALLAAPMLGLALQLLSQVILDSRRPYLFLSSMTDNMFDESLSWSVARFGYKENPFFVGHEFNGYLLTNSWAGNVYELLAVDPFTVVSSFGLLASLMSALLITHAISEKHGNTSRIALIAVILVGLQGSFGELFPFTEPPRIQHALAMSWFLLCIILIERLLDRTTFHSTALLLLITTAVLLGKTQMFSVVVGFFFVSSIFMSISQRRVKIALLGPASAAVLMIIYGWVNENYIGHSASSWVLHVDVDTLLLWVVPITITLVTRTMFPFTLFGMAGLIGNRFSLRVATVSVPTIIAYALVHDANGFRHLVGMTLLIGAISASPLVGKLLSVTPRSLIVTATGLGFGFGGLIVALQEASLVRGLNRDSLIRILTLEHPVRTLLAFIMVASAALIPLARRTIRRTHNRCLKPSGWHVYSVVALLVVGANIGSLISWSVREEVRGLAITSNGGEWPSKGPRDEPHISATNWVRKSTDHSSILATNALCKGLPPEGQVTPNVSSPDCALRNTASLIGSFTTRRLYLEGVSYAQLSDHIDTANQRYRDSILFATNNDPNSHERMIRDGVDYFVVDLGQTTLRDWEPRGTIRYQDDHYAVVELNN